MERRSLLPEPEGGCCLSCARRDQRGWMVLVDISKHGKSQQKPAHHPRVFFLFSLSCFVSSVVEMLEKAACGSGVRDAAKSTNRRSAVLGVSVFLLAVGIDASPERSTSQSEIGRSSLPMRFFCRRRKLFVSQGCLLQACLLSA